MSNPVNIKDLIGKRFGKLTIVRKSDFNKFQKTTFYCKCECGKFTDVTINALKRGNTTSCGCNRIGRITHGLKKHPLYIVWNSMKQRCSNPNEENYKHYGGRGISVCAEWKEDFKAFYDWCIANGWKRGLEIDRRDNDGGYSPNNCRCVTKKVNVNNRRVTIRIEYNGEIKTLVDWSNELGIKRRVLYDRLFILNQSVQRAFTNKHYNR